MLMDLRKLNTILLCLVMALIIVASLVLMKILFSDTKGFEWGSVSDWIIAISNIVMAIAAFYAAWNAKYWFKEKTKTLGLEKAESFLDDLDSFPTSFDSFINKLAEAELDFKSVQFDNPDIKKKTISELDKLSLSIDNNKLKLLHTYKKLNSLKRWDIKTEKENEIIKLLDAYDNTIISISNAAFNIRNAFSQSIDDHRFIDYFGSNFENHFAEAINYLREALSYHEKIQQYTFHDLFYL